MGSRKKNAPPDAQQSLNTADRAFSLGEYETAVLLYQIVCIQEPDAEQIYFKLGMALLKSQHVNEAIQNLRLAVVKEPDRKEIWLELARAYIEASDFETARRYLETLIQYDEVPLLAAEAHYELGRMCFARGDIGLAQDHFEAALSRDPEFLDADLALAQVLMYYRQYEHARQIYKYMLKHAPRLKKPAIAQELRTCLEAIGRENNDIKYWQPPPTARVQ